MSTGPVIPNDPIKLLMYDPTIEEPFINKHWSEGLCGFIAFISVCAANYASKRPGMSGIQKHIFFTAAGAYIGRIIEDHRLKYFADRDACLRHYIELHPEDFPPEERTKFANAFLPWVPIR